MSTDGIRRWAYISECGRYRYGLGREWDAAKPRVVFVMLNPSTADGYADDPTIRKCIGFAKRLGYGGLEVVNLYAFRATKPAELWKAPEPVGPFCDEYIVNAVTGRMAIVAWGRHGDSKRARPRADAVYKLLREKANSIGFLATTRDGIPMHPLMLPYSCASTAFAVQGKLAAFSSGARA